MTRIFRYEVPVDDRWHVLGGHSTPLFVSCRNLDVVEFWAWERPDMVIPVEYRVFGTGQPIDTPGSYVGTAIAPGGQLVWHLLRRT